ncbi:ATP-binding cassette domain-containing protein [Parasphingopyxis sp.]|uniref:ATP-binding cassette domain-containing protein n=1 Tax=Parasphingopyxis sp. TaxID=1920299 RepID=UPI0026309CC3|nr:ATP-binding cassette domain-containing protein [Parasphingopyxis sp.]
MAEQMTDRAVPQSSSGSLSSSRFVMLVGVTAVLFFLCLLPLEAIPEIPVDIDSKPFFIPLVLTALLPAGKPGIAIGLGVALGEGLRDLMEGYELDDPIGFIGYAIAFPLTSYVIAGRPLNPLLLSFGAIFCAFIQAAFEASSFLLFGEESIAIAVQSAIGNTITHGIIWGALPLVFLVPALHGRFERFLGFAPKGRHTDADPLPQPETGFSASPDAIAWADGLSFRYPGRRSAALDRLSFDVRRGEVLGVIGRSESGKSTLCRVMAGLAPKATGGEIAGWLETRGEAVKIGFVSDNPSALMTQTRPIREVEAALAHEATTAEDAETKALAALAELGIGEADARRYVWELPARAQLMIALAAATVIEPDILILDEVAAELDAAGLALLHSVVDAIRDRDGAVILVDNDVDRQFAWSDRIAILDGGRLERIDATHELLNDDEPLAAIGFPQPLALAGSATLDAEDIPPSAPPGIECLAMDAICFAYEDNTPILDGASLTVRAGEIVAVAGANGSGKTSLARLAVGLAEPSAGQIVIANQREGEDRFDHVAAVIHTPSAFFSERSVAAEIALPLRRAGLAAEEIRTRTAAVAEALDLGDTLEEDPLTLANGIAKRVQIATMLANGAHILILDEPAVRMDPVERALLKNAIRGLAAMGTAILLLDHDTDLIAELADHIYFLADGALTEAGTPGEGLGPANRALLKMLDLRVPHRFEAADGRANRSDRAEETSA